MVPRLIRELLVESKGYHEKLFLIYIVISKQIASHYRVIRLKLPPWVIFTPDIRAWLGLNQPKGRGKTMVGTSQLGGKKLFIDGPDQPGVSLA
jgi:hypothetical protein